VEHKQERLNKCLICGSKKLEKHLDTKDYFLSQQPFSLSRCAKCGFVFTNPRPYEKNLGPYYKSNDYISHSKKSGDRILDIGCATGQFLNEFKRRAWRCTGVEPDPAAIFLFWNLILLM